MTIGAHLPNLLSWTVWGHVLGGSVALATFLIPLASKKGGVFHVKSGWIYLIAMIVVTLSAFLVTPWRYFFDPSRTESTQGFAAFLFFIAFFSLTSLQQGIIVFKHKIRSTVSTFSTLGLPIGLMIIAALMLLYGLSLQKWLFVIFGILAFRTGREQFQFWKNPQKHKMDWWFFHLENMFTCCIATITAFAVTAIPRLFPNSALDSIWIWLLPTLVMVPWQIYFIRKYEKQFGLTAQ